MCDPWMTCSFPFFFLFVIISIFFSHLSHSAFLLKTHLQLTVLSWQKFQSLSRSLCAFSVTCTRSSSLPVRLSVCPFIYLSVRSTVYPLIRLSAHPTVPSSVCSFIRLSAYPSVYLSICLSAYICLSKNPCDHSTVCPLIHLSADPSDWSPNCSFNHLSIQPSVHSSMCPVTVHSPVCPSIHHALVH